MIRRLLVYYWRETCNITTVILLLVITLLTLFSQSLIRHDDTGEALLYEPINISFVDHDDSIISYVVRTQLADLDVVGQVFLDDMEQAQARLANNEILVILEMPSGFYEQTLTADKRDVVNLWLNEQMPAESNLFNRFLTQSVDGISTVQAALHAYQEELALIMPDNETYAKYSEAAMLDTAFRLIKRHKVYVRQQKARLRQFWFVVSSLTTLFAMLPALVVLMLAQREIESGRQARLLAANIAWWKITLSKLLIGLFWLAIALTPLLATLEQILPQLERQQMLMAVIPLFISMSLLSLAMAHLSTQTEAVMLTVWMLILAFLLLAGGIYPRQLLPGWLQALQPLSPAYWCFTQIYEGLYERPIALWHYLASIFTILPCLGFSYWAWERSRK